ncbi:MAG: flippase [Gemmatimonadota bacterium]
MKRLVKNTGYNLGSQVITTLAAFVCIPIAFRELGTERFGLLTLVWSLLAYALVFDLGTGPAVARATAASLVTDGGKRIGAIVRAGITIQVLLGVTAAVLVAGFAPRLLDLLRVPVTFQPDATLALYALAAALPVVLIAQSHQAVLEGLERFDIIAYVRTPVAVATYAIPAFGALAGWSFARIMFFVFITRVVAALVMHSLYVTKLPPAQNGVVRTELRALFRYSRWLAISGALAQVLIYLDRFVLSAAHGLTAVAQYGAPYDAAAKLLALPGSVGVAMFPGLSKDAARGEGAAAVARSRAAARVTIGLLAPICVVLIVFAGPLLRLWLGPQIGTEGVAAFRILLLATVLHAAAFAPVILIEAFGRSDAVARYNLLELVVYVPLLIVAISRFGVVGAAWAWTARAGGVMIWSMWYSRRYRDE